MSLVIYQLPFPNPDRADGFGSTSYVENGRTVQRARRHRGVDFAQPAGAKIKAIADGRVAVVRRSEPLGWVVVLEHARTSAERAHGARPVFSGYCHMSESPGLAVGAHVKRGDVIGTVGAQGKNGTEAAGPHLHLTLGFDADSFESGEVIDPLAFIEARTVHALGVSAAKTPAPPKRPKTYRVKKGDTLSEIGDRLKVDWRMIAELNGIFPPYTIFPDQVLRIT